MRVITSLRISSMVFATLLLCTSVYASDYEQWMSDAYPADGPGAAAIVIKDGKVIYRGASGMADMELSVPLTADNVFRLGSISKQFTAAGILLLEEQGKLNVSDDINVHLPEFPTHGHTITIENLLTHTSGIFNYTNIPGYFEGVEIRRDVTTAELIDVFANLPMDFAPGDAYLYSNSGYVLLGAIIEKVSGQSYAEYIQTAIFDELGMGHSYHGGLQLIPQRAHGYSGSVGEYKNAGFLSMTQPHGAGALLSTVSDMARWTQSLFGGELLSAESLEKMTTDFELNNGEHAGYGYGVGIGERFGIQEINHGGGIHGFTTYGTWIPDQKIYVAVLCNNDEMNPGFVASRMALDTAGADYPELTEIEVDPSSLADYVGVYEISDGDTRSVTVEDGHLYTLRGEGHPSEIVAHSEDAFFYAMSFTHLTFDRDNTGRVVSMSMYHEGADTAEVAKRISDSVEDD